MSPAATARQTGDVLLYLNGVTVSFDGFKALNELSLVVEETQQLNSLVGLGRHHERHGRLLSLGG